MYLALSIARSVGLILASAVVGALCCMALWHAFKLIRHPEWGPVLVTVPLALALADSLPDSEFLRRALVFAAVLAGPFWIAGLAWRTDLRDRNAAKRAHAIAESSSVGDAEVPLIASRYHRYPAIAACICEDRRPNPGELKRVALRVWREGLSARYPSQGFVGRRAALRAARAALEGTAAGRPA